MALRDVPFCALTNSAAARRNTAVGLVLAARVLARSSRARDFGNRMVSVSVIRDTVTLTLAESKQT